MFTSKLTLCREFFLGVGMTLFLCVAPQSDPIFTLALFLGMFTIYETFPEFHWVPAWTLYKIVNKEEDIVHGCLRIATQFLAATLAGIIGYQLLDVPAGIAYPAIPVEDDWRALVWVALIFGAWIALTQHGNAKEKDSFRRNFALTATFCSANYMFQGFAQDCILNSAVNFGRLVGAKVYYGGHKDEIPTEPSLEKIWILIVGPLVGVVLAYVGLMVDTWIAEKDAPATGNNEETTAVYGATSNDVELSKDDAKDAGQNA